tara:strand:- start:150 stop:431 length:282 start_codon:yes stop_codon:yes gene_type:complete
MYIREVKEGDLVIPIGRCGWKFFEEISDEDGKTYSIACTVGRGWANSLAPAMYLGKTKFNQRLRGLYTWHRVLIENNVYLIEGYESSHLEKIT